MRKKQVIVLLIVFAFINVSIVSMAMMATAKPDNGLQLTEDVALMDLTHENFVERDSQARKLDTQTEPMITPGSSPASQGDEITVSVSDNYLGLSYNETFVVVEDGTNGIILVEKDAYDSFDGTNYYFANPYGDDSEPWLRTVDIISETQLHYLLNEFDTNIYEVVTGVFGDLNPRGAEGQKVWVLIHNIRDAAYYLPGETSYIAGYFSSGENADNNKNMFHIDSYDWLNRVGPDGARPQLYEGVFAHEFEHMVHYDVDPDEPSWVDEGLADLAGYLSGYGHSNGHIMYYMAYHWFTPLTFWGGGLEDYGASYLFQLYLYEKFGGADFVSALVQEQANGIEGIENTLRSFGIDLSFDKIFDRWTIANYLDDTSRWGGMYGYETLEMGSADTNGWTLEYSLSAQWGEPIFEAPFGLWGWWGVPQPYTAHYYRFINEDRAHVYFNGDESSGTPAFSGMYEWYSDAEAWAWRSFSQTFDIPDTGATLSFMTNYDIEEDWDYGYVEVYDHDTGTWTTLEDNEGYTVTTDPFAQDNPNVPEDREPRGYVADSNWHAFTGYSNGWVAISMDLGAFAEHTIDIHFRTWQDGAFTLQMMYVDDISIPEIGFFDDVEGGEDGWATDGWYVTDGILDNNWEVTVVNLDYPVSDPVPLDLNWVHHMHFPHNTQSSSLSVRATKDNHIRLMIISNHANHILPADYYFSVE